MNFNFNAASSVQNNNQFQLGFQHHGSEAGDLLAKLKGTSRDPSITAKDKLDSLISALNNSDDPALQQIGAAASDAADQNDGNIDEDQAQQLVQQLSDLLKAAQGQQNDVASRNQARSRSLSDAGESAVRY